VAYLLAILERLLILDDRMVAVMTMNVGYFLSILAGVFLGSVIFGRFMAHSGSH
jgi:hypothetical protein